MTGRDLVAASSRLIGVLAEGESLSAQGAVDALASLNRMIGGWSTQRLLIYAIVREIFPLSGGTQTYTMGDGATFDTDRPIKIERAGILITGSGQTVEYPVKVITFERWADVCVKTINSDIPCELYPEGTFPNETLNFWPIPSTAAQVALYSRKALTSIATLDTDVSLPPGYDEALVYNLAVRLAPEYGKAIDPAVAQVATESLSNLKAVNHVPRHLKSDPALVSRGKSYNIYRGDSD